MTQDFEDGEHPICYASRMLKLSEKNYTVSEKEMVAVKFGIEKFRPYVEGTHFEIVTDHKFLKYLRNLKDPTGRLARWALFLQQ